MSGPLFLTTVDLIQPAEHKEYFLSLLFPIHSWGQVSNHFKDQSINRGRPDPFVPNQPKYDLLLSLHFFLSASRRSGKDAFSDAGDFGLGLECGMNGWFD